MIDVGSKPWKQMASLMRKATIGCMHGKVAMGEAYILPSPVDVDVELELVRASSKETGAYGIQISHE